MKLNCKLVETKNNISKYQAWVDDDSLLYYAIGYITYYWRSGGLELNFCLEKNYDNLTNSYLFTFWSDVEKDKLKLYADIQFLDGDVGMGDQIRIVLR